LAGDVAELLSGADAVVFAADAGPGSGAGRKASVDRAACVLVAGAAGRAGPAGSCKSLDGSRTYTVRTDGGVAGATGPGCSPSKVPTTRPM
jgi:hypothetical protein